MLLKKLLAEAAVLGCQGEKLLVIALKPPILSASMVPIILPALPHCLPIVIIRLSVISAHPLSLHSLYRKDSEKYSNIWKLAKNFQKMRKIIRQWRGENSMYSPVRGWTKPQNACVERLPLQPGLWDISPGRRPYLPEGGDEWKPYGPGSGGVRPVSRRHST